MHLSWLLFNKNIIKISIQRAAQYIKTVYRLKEMKCETKRSMNACGLCYCSFEKDVTMKLYTYLI